MTNITRTFAALSAAVIAASQLLAQQPPAQPPPAQQPPAAPAPAAPAPPATPAPGGGQGRGNIATFPAQQRPPGDPVVIARGNAVYGIECRSCHGPDLRGGDLGGPNLLRSQIVLNDAQGELMHPIIAGSRQAEGMPAIKMSDDDVKAVATYIHSVVATARGQGAPPAGPPIVLNVLVGDATAGQNYFAAKCGACHSPAGDLAGIGARVPNAMELQNLWVAGGTGGRGGRGSGGAARGSAPSRRDVMATVTLSSGQRVEGRLERIDDFFLTVTPEGGMARTFRRDGETPKIEIRDPLEGHKNLLPVYTDKDVHDVTAYLASLK
jgi:cytochrome c oxidase cbb3-type subunit III